MKYVIIGAGAAGLTAAKTLRAKNYLADITIISEDELIHSRCILHKYISGERDEASLSFVPDDFIEANRINWKKGVKATSIDPLAKNVLCGKEAVQYDKLLIAGGSIGINIPLPALGEAVNVYGLRNLEDAKAIKKATAYGKQAVVIGAGLVGLDAAYAMLNLNKDVAIVEMANRILSLNLDEKPAERYQRRFEAEGARFYLGRKVVDVTLDWNRKITHVRLDNGALLPCDFVVSAAGARPAVDFLDGSGIEIKKAVSVNSHMATNYADIYAAGDITGLSAIWPNAMRQGEVAALNMCGGNEVYDDTFTAKNTINFFGLVTLSLGSLEPSFGERMEIIEDRKGYKKIVWQGNYIVGLVMQGDISNSGFWQYLIKNKMPVVNNKKPTHKISYADYYSMDERGNYRYTAK